MMPADTYTSITVVIPTLGRERVLLDTVKLLLPQLPESSEILLLDQTPAHAPETEDQLSQWAEQGQISWIRRPVPGLVAAMNAGLAAARSELVLFLDDDIRPSPELLSAHISAHRVYPEAWAIAGQVLQPGEVAEELAAPLPRAGFLADLAFPFRSACGDWVANVMAGNLSVKRGKIADLHGFDEDFIPPVSYRFETDFARRILQAGGRIRFVPEASIQHLRAASGGTRSLGSHLTSASPLHGVGDYLFALRHASGWQRMGYMLKRPFREIRTKFHLAHPWWMPVKFFGELRAMRLAFSLFLSKGRGA